MRKSTLFSKFTAILLAALLMAGTAAAQEDPPDFANDPLAGPAGTGSIVLDTPGDIMMSFGARARIIPTSENNWDFGFGDDLNAPLLGGLLDDGFFKVHPNESGWVNEDYIRTETQIYFNAMPRDRKWSFHAALEFDRPVDTVVVDERGGRDDTTSDFGLERLTGSYAINPNLRFNAGWDIWFMPDPAGLTYGDDAPGFWLDGDYGTFDFSLGYFKMSENNWGTSFNSDWLTDSDNSDRDLYAGYLNYNVSESNRITGLYMYDRMRNVETGTLQERILLGAKDQVADLEALGVQRNAPALDPLLDTVEHGQKPKTDSHYLGLIYEGSGGLINYFVEGIYQFGQADGTGLDQHPTYAAYGHDDYDINAFAFAGDLELDLSDSVGYGFKPHVGFIYTSGDDDPEDDNLEGYTGSLTFQRWTTFGGENTILGDGNVMMGTVLYSFLPGLYGNGTPVVAGGLPNANALGTARADNPGLTMSSLGFSLAPKRYLMFKSNINSFWWNEDISVPSFVQPGVVTEVDSGYVGTEWDNELTLALSKNTFVKGQAAVLFPGSVMDDVTAARSATIAGPGEESDDVAYRLGAEFIWQF